MVMVTDTLDYVDDPETAEYLGPLARGMIELTFRDTEGVFKTGIKAICKDQGIPYNGKEAGEVFEFPHPQGEA